MNPRELTELRMLAARGIEVEIERLNGVLSNIKRDLGTRLTESEAPEALSTSNDAPRPAGVKRTMSPEARKRISQRMKAMWKAKAQAK